MAAARAARDDWAGVVALAVPALNPGWLYLQATPLTEPLAFGLMAGLALFLVRWREYGRRKDLWAAAACSALGCLVRYEAWAVGAVAVVVIALARGRSFRDAFRFTVVGLVAPIVLFGPIRGSPPEGRS